MSKEKMKKIMKVIIVIAVIIIPVMYSFFYLKAFWDPYGNLKTMKIAVVNLDEGDNGENLGKELSQKLVDKDVMTIDVLNNSDEAEEKLVNQEYYATITIPKDFTQKLNNAENKDREVTTISYSPNQKSNYLASQIINKVITTVESELKSQVSEKVVGKLSDKLDEVPGKMQEISDGAGQIQDGTQILENGLTTLNNGTNSLESNYSKFNDGVNSAYDATKQLKSGVNKLSNGVDTVVSGSDQLAEGAESLSKVQDGLGQLSAGTGELSKGTAKYVKGVNTLIAGVQGSSKQVTTLATDIQTYIGTEAAKDPAIMADPNIQKIVGDLKTIQGNPDSSASIALLVKSGPELQQGVEDLDSNVKEFGKQASSLSELQDGTKKLKAGLLQVKSGVNTLQDGTAKLNNGMSELNSNSGKILNGVQSLNDGSQKALDGTQELSSGVNTFKTEIDNGISYTQDQLENLDGLDTYVKDPLTVNEEDYGQISQYGVAFAPYFMSISLWVGALIMLIIFLYDPEDRFKLLGMHAKNKFLRAGLYAVISILQGIVLGFILKAGLGFSVTNLGLYYLTCILISLTFYSIMQFLLLNFGDVGKFLGILFLVLQLAASAGTFPLETVPKFFQDINKYMPMTYTIRLIKEAIIKIDAGCVGKNVSILIGITVVFLALTLAFDIIKNKKNNKKNNK